MKTSEGTSAMAASVLLGIASLAAAAPAPAHDATRLLSKLKSTYPGTRFDRAVPTPIAGWYEVWMGTNVAYVSSRNVRYFVFGHLFDARTQTDLTAPKVAHARQDTRTERTAATSPPSVTIDTLPLVDAITRVQGDGTRTLVLFSDPGCPFCRQLEPALTKLDRVTIHTFIVPFQGRAQAQAIWCASDRATAWQAAMAGLAVAAPEPAPECLHPLDRNLALARRLRIVATPTLVFADGTRLEGTADTAALESRLVAASADPAHANPTASPETFP